MKRFLLKNVDGFAWIAILILSLCGFTTAAAKEGATSAEINAAIVNSPVAVTWVNDTASPWYIVDFGDGSAWIVCDLESGQRSTISSIFTLDIYSLLTIKPGDYYSSDSTPLDIYIDGNFYKSLNSEDIDVVLPPGEHTIECSIYNGSSYNSVSSCWISAFVIDQQWDEVRVDFPGNFKDKVYDLVYALENRKLHLLKISGTMSSEDWQTLRGLTRFGAVSGDINWDEGVMSFIRGIDLSDTDVTDIPDFCFSSFDNEYGSRGAQFDDLSTVIFPETLKRISYNAFYGNSNIFHIHIPSSVELIEPKAFSGSSLRYISFQDNSSLKLIYYEAFSSTLLQEFKMPDSTILVGSNAFSGCKQLSNIKLSNTLSTIADEAFSLSGLTEINIPKTVKTLGHSVFASCTKLRKATLNSHTKELVATFSDCAALDTIIIKSATAPGIIATNDPFNNVKKDAVTLLVPDFALESYKSDTYWSQFTGVKASQEISESDFWAIHGYVKQTEDQKFSGTPSIELESGGVFDISENTTLPLNEVVFSNEDVESPCFFNMSNGVTMNNLVTRYVFPNRNCWYFFSPATDVNMADITYSNNASWVIRYYDGESRASGNKASGNWKNMPANGTLKSGQGYVIKATKAGILNMPSKASDYGVFLGIENAPITLSDFTSETVENTGWNLVANPYPTFYDSRSINCEAPITVWTGSTYRAFSLSDDAYVLRPLQPFFVQKYTDDISFEIPKEGRQNSINVTRARTQRILKEESDRDCFNIEIISEDSDEADDYTRIVINESALMTYEGNRDAVKFMSMDTDVAQLYSLGENSSRLAINERPYFDGNAALGVYVPKVGETYCISASRLDRDAWLYDGLTGCEHDLTSGGYSFTADKSGFDDSRFSIRLAPTVDTSVIDVEKTLVNVTSGRGLISIDSSSCAEVLVVTADGRIIANEKAEDGILEVPAPAGVYMVKVNGKGYKTIVK